MIFTQHFNRIKELYVKHERYVTPAAFFLGFVWDNLTLRRIDLWFENIVIIWNLLLVGLFISLINAYEAGHLHNKIVDKVIRFVPIFMQFAFGGLFSAFFVFYSRSASVFSSWPFLLLLLALFIGNEFFRKRYLRLTFQLSIFFIVLFAYSVFAVPVLLGQMGGLVFIASGFVALVALGLMIFALSKIIPERVEQNRDALFVSVASIYVIFHIFYFTNIMPPVPLSLKESGVYHSIERAREENNIYKVSFEPSPWYLFFKDASSIFHWSQGSPIYVYSAIFAPTEFNTKISHRWMYFDTEEDSWVERGNFGFVIIGGRDDGYRGYTFKTDITPGKWRVEVITERDQVLGRRTFKVVETETAPELKTTFR